MNFILILKLFLIVLLYVYIGISIFFLKNRNEKQNIIENTVFNVVIVILYNILCYLPLALPSTFQSELLNSPFIGLWFRVAAVVLAISGFFLLIKTIIKRKTIGGQDTAGILHTSGIYSFARHPIYLGIVLNSLAISLFMVNAEGLILFLLIFLANVLQSRVEERYDMLARFNNEYIQYRRKTPAFGPLAIWVLITIVIVVPVVIVRLAG